MPLTLSEKAKLNALALQQPTLQDTSKPYPQSSMLLGDVLDNMSAACVVKATYDFAIHGGAIGTKALGVTIPAGAIVTRLWTDAATTLASSGSATVAVEAGATVLKAATAFNDASLVGVDVQSLVPVKLVVASELEVVIAAAALTAGKLNVFVEYLK